MASAKVARTSRERARCVRGVTRGIIPRKRLRKSCSGSASAAEARRRQSEATPELTGEVGGALEADAFGDLAHACAVAEQEGARSFEANLAEVAHGGHAGDGAEAMREMGRAHRRALGQRFDRELFGVVLANE